MTLGEGQWKKGHEKTGGGGVAQVLALGQGIWKYECTHFVKIHLATY